MSHVAPLHEAISCAHSCVQVILTFFSAVATFGLEPSYTFSEDLGLINVCVEQKEPSNGCGVQFEFNVSITASRGSAGIYTVCVCV